MQLLKYILAFSLLMCCCVSWGQDKLLLNIEQSTNPKQKASLYFELGKTYAQKGQKNKEYKAFEDALTFCESDLDKANMLKKIGDFYVAKVLYFQALKYREDELKIRLRNNDLVSLAGAYNNLAITYNRDGQYQKSLKTHYKALEIRKKINDKKAISDSYINIAYLYQRLNDYHSAYSKYREAIKIKSDIQDLYGLGSAYLNLGGLQILHQQSQRAIENLNQAIQIFTTTKESNLLGYAFVNKAEAHTSLKQIKEAKKALESAEKLPKQNTYLKAGINEIKASISLLENRTDLSILYLTRAESLFEQMGEHKKQSEITLKIADQYFENQNFKKATNYLEKHTKINQYIQEKSNQNSLLELKQRFSSEEKEQEIAIQTQELEAQQKRNIFLGTLGALLSALLVLLVMSIKKRKHINHTIQKQKKEIQKSQNDTLQNITVAQSIQEKILPPKSLMKTTFKEHFIYYSPRDIVSGDFYWVTQKQNAVYFATADCTGHGVPGALMSVLSKQLLDEIAQEHAFEKPSDILNALHLRLVERLKQKDKKNSQDGLDLFLGCYYPKEKRLEFAGAKRSAFVLRKTGINEKLKTTLRSVGGTSKFDAKAKAFETFTLSINSGDTLIMYTDGITDQFGGLDRKKFGTSRFKTILESYAQKNLIDLKFDIKKQFDAWRNNEKQTDDVLVFGIRF